MTEFTNESALAQTVALLTHYGFEMKGYTAQEVISRWLINYQANWIRLAVVEALYQGRYKTVSVDQILSFWFKRGNPMFHFNHDFECLICLKLPCYLEDENKSLELVNSEVSKVSQSSLLESEEKQEQVIIDKEQIPVEKKQISEKQISEVIKIPISEEEREDEIVTSPQPKTTEQMTVDISSQKTLFNHQVYLSPIHRFTPTPDVSNFYLKLKAVALNSSKQMDWENNSEKT